LIRDNDGFGFDGLETVVESGCLCDEAHDWSWART